MDFTRDEVQRELCELARRILESRVTPDFLRAHALSGTPYDAVLWDQLHEAGLVTAALPAAAGGSAFGLLELGWILEAAGRVLAPVPLLSTSVGARALAAAAAMDHPSNAAQWLQAVVERRAVVALALMDASDDPLAPALTATPVENAAGGWQLDGYKTAVAHGAEAEVLLVSAMAPAGPMLFAVPGDTPGLQRRPQRSTHGQPWALVALEGALLPDTARLGAVAAVNRLVDETRTALAAWQLGVAESALRQTAAYVSSRHQFGRPLGSMQAVQQRIADAYIDVEAMRSTQLLAAAALEAVGAPAAASATTTADVAVASYWAALGGHRVTHAAQHLHGGMGADVEYPIHRHFLDAKATGLALGGAESLLARIGTEIAAGRIRRLSGVET